MPRIEGKDAFFPVALQIHLRSFGHRRDFEHHAAEFFEGFPGCDVVGVAGDDDFIHVQSSGERKQAQTGLIGIPMAAVRFVDGIADVSEQINLGGRADPEVRPPDGQSGGFLVDPVAVLRQTVRDRIFGFELDLLEKY